MMSDRLSETAYAKINLALHVRHRRADGYHALETIFAFCTDGDTVCAQPAERTLLTIDGPFGAGLSTSDNLILRAALLMPAPVSLHLTKRLPVASGIGGGSADAAATLRLLNRLTGDPLPPVAAQRALGADVPACVLSETRRGAGVGEALTATPGVTGIPVLLINPGIALSTAAVFARWDGVDRGPLDQWQDGRNDLEAAACALVPEIGVLIAWLNRCHDVTLARMSGSGATCFALFASDAARDEAARAAARDWPGYWTMPSVLR
jgi:4-diphosphocytidyl-2-C-methyl-D-erythritol kinase